MFFIVVFGLFGFLEFVWFSSSLFSFYCVLDMFPLYVLDQVQLTWMTHGKTASLKMRKKAVPKSPCSV